MIEVVPLIENNNKDPVEEEVVEIDVTFSDAKKIREEGANDAQKQMAPNFEWDRYLNINY